MILSRTLSIQTPRWAAPLLQPNHRYRAAYGGRGSGKSHFFAELLIERCIEKKTQAVCLRETQKSLSQSVKQLLENKIQDLDVGHLFEVQRDRIIGKNGSLIQFHGLQNHTADSIKSLEGIDIAWIEEAQSVSQRSLDILRPTIRKQGSEIWASWNPGQPTDPIEFLRREPPRGTICIQVNYTENPWLPQTLIYEMGYDRSRDIDKFSHVWLGGYVKNSEARVFKNWRIEEFEADRDIIHRLGLDFGFAIDPTVGIRCHLVGRKLYIDYEAYMHHCEIVNMPELIGAIPDSDLFPIIADSSRPETISHLQKHGYPKIFPSVKGSGSIEEGVAWLQSYDIIVHPRCVHTIDELTNYSYIVDKLTNMITSKLPDKKNHVIDAIRYACEAVRRVQQNKSPVTTKILPIQNYWSPKK